MSQSPSKTRVAAIKISVWDEPTHRELGDIQTEREHLRTTLTVEIDANAPILSIEGKISSAFCALIDNCPELKRLHRRHEGLFIAPFDGEKQGLPDSIGASLWEDGNAAPSAEAKGEILWSDN